jgi:FtsZ-binding cell division protein ZapB
MEHKVDATIRVLEVVKEELKKEQQQQRQTASAPVKPDLAATLKTTIDRVKRLWDEIQEIRREEAARTGRPLPDDAASGQWASDMSDKLQKSIEAMQVLKGELDEMKKDEASSAN